MNSESPMQLDSEQKQRILNALISNTRYKESIRGECTREQSLVEICRTIASVFTSYRDFQFNETFIQHQHRVHLVSRRSFFKSDAERAAFFGESSSPDVDKTTKEYRAAVHKRICGAWRRLRDGILKHMVLLDPNCREGRTITCKRPAEPETAPVKAPKVSLDDSIQEMVRQWMNNNMMSGNMQVIHRGLVENVEYCIVIKR